MRNTLSSMIVLALTCALAASAFSASQKAGHSVRSGDGDNKVHVMDNAASRSKYGDGLVNAVKGVSVSDMLKNARSANTMGRNALDKAASTLMQKGKVYPATGAKWKAAWNSSYMRLSKSGGVRVCPGILAAGGRLLVSTGNGAASGFLVFAADAGTACYRYHQGDINDAEFAEQLSDAVLKGLVVGAAVAVTVMLGATPSGWCVLAVATATYIVVDIGIRIWREIRNQRYLGVADLEAFGIRQDSVLDVRDSILEVRENIMPAETHSLLKP